MKINELIEILDKQSPRSEALDWDNVGLLVGDENREVKTVYIALDATDKVIENAIRAKADLILTHHPMIFSGMKRIVASDFTGRRVMRLIEHGIAVYAMHTNFDIYGMAQLAEARLGLRDADVLDVVSGSPIRRSRISHGATDWPPTNGRGHFLSGYGETEQGIGRVGFLADSISLGEYAGQVRDIFGLSHVRVFGDEDTEVYRVAVCPGSGKSVVDTAVEADADVLVTGDIDHHTGIDSVMKGMAVIDAGHYGIEHIFVEYMAGFLSENAGELKVYTHPGEEPFWMA
jgi:dinuclear metal center YbgI/SA1388 family protein